MPGISPENKQILESDRLRDDFEAVKASEKETITGDEKAKAYRQARRAEIEKAHLLQKAEDEQKINELKQNIEDIPTIIGSENKDDLPAIIGTEVEKPAA